MRTEGILLRTSVSGFYFKSDNMKKETFVRAKVYDALYERITFVSKRKRKKKANGGTYYVPVNKMTLAVGTRVKLKIKKKNVYYHLCGFPKAI